MRGMKGGQGDCYVVGDVLARSFHDVPRHNRAGLGERGPAEQGKKRRGKKRRSDNKSVFVLPLLSVSGRARGHKVMIPVGIR